MRHHDPDERLLSRTRQLMVGVVVLTAGGALCGWRWPGPWGWLLLAGQAALLGRCLQLWWRLSSSELYWIEHSPSLARQWTAALASVIALVGMPPVVESMAARLVSGALGLALLLGALAIGRRYLERKL